MTAEVLGGRQWSRTPLFGHDVVVSGVVNTSRHAETIQVKFAEPPETVLMASKFSGGPMGYLSMKSIIWTHYGQDVSKRCAFRRLDLATINSLALDEWTQMAFGGGRGYWVGLVQDRESGVYAWESGAPATYDRLDSEHPQAPFGIIDGTGRWSTAEADVRYGALFELAESCCLIVSHANGRNCGGGCALSQCGHRRLRPVDVFRWSDD